MSDESVAERAAAALVETTGAEAQPEDPTAAFAQELQKAGVTKEGIPAAMNYLRMLQSQEGQAAIVEQYLATDRGKAARERFATEELARLAAVKPEALLDIALKSGARLPGTEEDDVPVEDKLSRQIQAMEARFAQKLAQLEQGHKNTSDTVKGALDKAAKQEEFLSWASGPTMKNSNLKTEQFKAIFTRAEELLRLDPGKYAGPGSFGRAASDAHAALTSAASVFAPPQGPRGLRSSVGVSAKAAPVVPDFDANPNMTEGELYKFLNGAISEAAQDVADRWTGLTQE